MIFAQNLKYLRKKRGLSQDYIADKLGYKSFTTVQKWESGVSEPPIEKLTVLSEMFGISMDQLLRVDLTAGPSNNLNIDSSSTAGNVTNKKQIPILSRISAAVPILGDDYLEGYELVEDESLDYALRVKGDAMSGIRICEDDLVYVCRDCDISNGDLVVTSIHEEDATVKRFYQYGKKIVLRPENANLKELEYEARDVKLLGKVKSAKISFL